MKNRRFILFFILMVLIGSSCKKFFDVTPQTEIVKDQLFQKESGFRDALAGVYIQLKDNSAYGQAMTMTTLEYLVSSWDVTTNTPGYWMGLYNYNEVRTESNLAGIYRQQYKIIGAINEILGQIDNRKDVFSEGMYEMIKGECLALRAYCHFDILRLFGPLPTNPSVGNKLAYVKSVSTAQNPLLSFDVFKTELISDLNTAESLLKDVDPFTKYSITDFKKGNYKPDNDFSSYRYLRMNFYAVKALQARAYLWFNDAPKAYEAARFVIDAKNTDGTVKFRLGNATDMGNKDYALSCEHIMALYDFQLLTKYTSMFPTGNFYKGTNATIINNELFGNTGTDIREASLWALIAVNSYTNIYTLKKYASEASNMDNYYQIPLLRVSEMYMIAMETAPLTEANSLWSTFLLNRNYTDAELPADAELRKLRLIKEYRKEFYAEGQAFFAYKRINAPKSSVLFSPAAATINYLPPLPKIETTITQ